MSGRHGKRKEGGGGGGGKSNKRRFINKAAPAGAKAGMAQGSKGILVSCINSKEQQAGREAVQLFTEAYEALGGTWKPAASSAAAAAPDAAGDAPPTDIAAALAAEVAEVKEGSKQALFYHTVGMHSVVFVECKDPQGPSPTALVQHVCAAVDASRVNSTRWCNRFYPIEHTCYASMEKIEELAAAVAAEHFPEGGEQIEFAVNYDARAAPQTLERMKVIDAFATPVPKPHKVNLTAPQKTILVNIVKTTVGVAVVENFRKLLRFNIHSLALSDEERAAQQAQAQAAGGGGGGGAAAAKQAVAEKKEAELEQRAAEQQQQQQEEEPASGVVEEQQQEQQQPSEADAEAT